MTNIEDKIVKCANCGTESEQLIIYSENFAIGSKEENKEQMMHLQKCPKCGYEAPNISKKDGEDSFTSKSLKNKNVKSFFMIFFIILIVITVLIIGNIPRCPNNYKYDKASELCYTILETNAETHTEQDCLTGYFLIDGKCYDNAVPMTKYPTHHNIGLGYGYDDCPYGYYLSGTLCYPNSYPTITKEVEECPDGYTKNSSGVLGLEMPTLHVPGIPTKCYRREIVKPKSYFEQIKALT